MQSSFISQLSSTDWNEEWKKLQKARNRTDSSVFWDERSKTFTTKDSPNAYVEDFLRLADIQPGDAVFDMGCGTGALAIPLAKKGCTVMAADFSQGMLNVMAENQKQQGAGNITPVNMSWNDDWSAFGITQNSADVCIASRSMAVADMRDALLRLTDVARRRVCITLATDSSPRTDERILRAIGLAPSGGKDHQYAMNILMNEGIKPSLNYIHSIRSDTFDNFDDAYATLSRMVNDVAALHASDQQRETALDNLREWLEANLIENQDVNKPDKKGIPQKPWRLREHRLVTWAFISWDA